MGFLYLTFTNERIDELSDTKASIYSLLRKAPDMRQVDLADQLSLSEQYVRKVIKKLKDRELLERAGLRKNGYWKIVDK